MKSTKARITDFPAIFWRCLQEQRDRWILWTPVPMAAGIGAYFLLPAEPPLFLGAVVLAFLALAAVPFYRNLKFFYPWLAVFLCVMGFTAAQFRTWSVDTAVLDKKINYIALEGRIIDVDALAKTYRVTLDEMKFISDRPLRQKELPERVRIRLKANDPYVPEAGDRITLKAGLLPLSAPVLPGSFDFQQYAYFHRLGATGYALSDVAVVEARSQSFFFEDLRKYLREGIWRNIEDKSHAALALALLLGDRAGLSEEDWETARMSGIAHLISISGSHFAIIAGFVFFLTRAMLATVPYVALRYPIKKISALVAMGVAIFYMLLIGAPIPAQRAVIMLGLVTLAILIDRDPFSLRLVAFAAVALFIFKPESLVGPSFQLSFAAVIALIAAFEAARGFWQKNDEKSEERRNLLRGFALFVVACFMTTLVATLATGPFSLYYFHRMPVLSGLIANMVAVPVTSFVTIPFGILGCLLMPLGLEQWPLRLTEWSIDVVMDTARMVISWPHMVLYTDAWPWTYLLLMAMGGLWLCIWKGRVRWIGFAPIFIGIALVPLAPRADILISDDGRLAAVRGEDGVLWISSKKISRFVRESWIEEEGTKGVAEWPAPGRGPPSGFLRCDDMACLYKMKGKTVSFIRNTAALEQDCAAADIVILPLAAAPKNCGRAQVIDKWDLREGGAHALYLAEKTEIRTANGTRGKRPWVGSPSPYPSPASGRGQPKGKALGG